MINLGGWSVFIIFVVFLYVTGSLADLTKTIPYLISDQNYSPSDIIQPSKITYDLYKVYGLPNIIAYLFCFIATIYSCYLRKNGKENRTLKTILFAFSCLVLSAMYIWATHYLVDQLSGRYLSVQALHELPILFISLIWILLYNNNNNKNLLMFWFVSLLYSLCVDIASDWVLGMGGRIAIVPGFIACFYLCKEFICQHRNETKPKKTIGKTFRVNRSSSKKESTLFISRCICSVVISFGIIFLSYWYIGQIYTQGFFQLTEKVFESKNTSLSETISVGPNKGLITSSYIKKTYEDSFEDLDVIKQLNKKKEPFLVFDVYPMAYLYLDYPYATTTSYFISEENRINDYWNMFPEKKAAYVYIPNFQAFVAYRPYSEKEMNEKLSFFSETKYKLIEGKAGLIIVIER